MTELAALSGIQDRFGTIVVDPPWRFQNRTGKMAPEHRRLHRYRTMTFEEIAALPVEELAEKKSHLYLWTPNALLPEALQIMKAWDSGTGQTWSGTRFARTADPTAEA